MIAPRLSVQESINEEFVALLPELTSRLNQRFRFRGLEACEECVAEGVGLSWMMFVSARRRSKHVSASNLSFYAGRAVEAGRKVAGASGLDALSDTALARKRIPTHVNLGDTADSLTVFCRTFGDKRWRWPIVDYVAAQ